MVSMKSDFLSYLICRTGEGRDVECGHVVNEMEPVEPQSIVKLVK